MFLLLFFIFNPVKADSCLLFIKSRQISEVFSYNKNFLSILHLVRLQHKLSSVLINKSLTEYNNIFQGKCTCLTLYLLKWRIWWAPNKASNGQMGFNSAFKGLSLKLLDLNTAISHYFCSHSPSSKCQNKHKLLPARNHNILSELCGKI